MNPRTEAFTSLKANANSIWSTPHSLQARPSHWVCRLSWHLFWAQDRRVACNYFSSFAWSQRRPYSTHTNPMQIDWAISAGYIHVHEKGSKNNTALQLKSYKKVDIALLHILELFPHKPHVIRRVYSLHLVPIARLHLHFKRNNSK